MRRLAEVSFFVLLSSIAAAQVQIPEGTPLRVRLEGDLSSATAQEGQSVALTVVDEVSIEGSVVIPAGAPVLGHVTQSVPKSLGRNGKLDFSVESVTAGDGEAIRLRYSRDQKSANTLSKGIMSAGAVVFLGPAGPLIKVMSAKDATVQRGTVVQVFTDEAHVFKTKGPALTAGDGAASQASNDSRPVIIVVSINSTPAGAQVTVDGTAMGETPASFQIEPGGHEIQLQKEGFAVWKQKVTAKPGEPIDLDAKLRTPAAAKPAATKRSTAKTTGPNP
jgi:hypothetical protein